nr:MAG TPA: hypothetical protein [Caudoviricetes sp.]
MYYGIVQHLQMTLVIPWKKLQKRISKNYQVAKKEVCLVVTETIDKPTKIIIVMTKEEITHIFFKKMWLSPSGYPRFPRSAMYAYRAGVIREEEKERYGIDKIIRRYSL